MRRRIGTHDYYNWRELWDESVEKAAAMRSMESTSASHLPESAVCLSSSDGACCFQNGQHAHDGLSHKTPRTNNAFRKARHKTLQVAPRVPSQTARTSADAKCPNK